MRHLLPLGVARLNRLLPYRHSAALVIPLLTLVNSASAQFFGLGGSEVIKDARVLTGDGRTLEKVSIEIKGGKISDLGANVKAGLLGKSYDATGKTVTPGLIDLDSRLGMLMGTGGRADATSRAFDAWDAYAADVYADAYRNGVTTVYVGPSSGAGILGAGAVVSLSSEAGRVGAVLKEDAALQINLASNQSPLARLNTLNGVRRQFRDALEYRTSLEDYKNDLEEYEKKIKERADKKAKEEADKKAKEEADKKGKESPDKKGDAPKSEPKKDETPGKPAPKGEPPKDSPHPRPGPKPEPKPEPKPDPKPDPKPEPKPDPTPPPKSDAGLSDVAVDDNFAPPAPPAPGSPKDASGDAAKKDAKEEEIKKPNEPRPDRTKDMLLRAIDRKLPVRITAHRSEDILNALDLAAEFNLDVVLVGATEAYLVADEIAKAKVPVVLGPSSLPALRADNEWRRHADDSAGKLNAAGVRFGIGSGAGSVFSGRFVLQNAQLACAQSNLARSPLQLVTGSAAGLLGLEDCGRVGRGQRADLVVWSADPSDPSATVERVYVGGKVVYDAAKAGKP